jgi:nucleoside-diphosphate-sugar epimerase
MKVAIFGANSEIARDLILSNRAKGGHEFLLCTHRPQLLDHWLQTNEMYSLCRVLDYANLVDISDLDCIINFVGVGNPARLIELGKKIYDITIQYDNLAIDYIKVKPHCRYIYISSGVVYGTDFTRPAGIDTKAEFALNKIQIKDWYALSKIQCEFRHRSLDPLPIMDLRVFNYFSQNQNIEARYLITDIARAIRNDQKFQTSSVDIARDYIGPADFWKIINVMLMAPLQNTTVDCYSRSPVRKVELLQAMSTHFGLKYFLDDGVHGVDATGTKFNYFSTYSKAADLGYVPRYSALENVMEQMSGLI